jgi:cytochrome c-type biogenesis protein CcmF
VLSLAGISIVAGVLAAALFTKDFSFAYVAQYSSKTLPWHYSLSAMWVGQSGSLLLWTCFCGILVLLLGLRTSREKRMMAADAGRDEIWHSASYRLRVTAMALSMGFVCFLAAVMVFAADPMEASVSAPRDGSGLSPLLQHPAMLFHPPVIFLGYALWTMPFALSVAALITGETGKTWVKIARPWSLAAWSVLGLGILWGANWAYEELGWGGYWAWDPVENGSLIPWLTGTALIHALMAWQYRGTLKRTAIALAIATFALCNFATFLTRSGVFSSLHAFSASPIGWLFLALMTALAAVGGSLLFIRRDRLRSDTRIRSVLSRESLVITSIVGLLLLTAVTITGTVSAAISSMVLGRAVEVGPSFFNHALVPTGLLLVSLTAVTPLMRWSRAPSPVQSVCLVGSATAGIVAAAVALGCGVNHPIHIFLVAIATLAATTFGASIVLDAARSGQKGLFARLLSVVQVQRTQYAGFVMHMGFICLAIGIAGSSLGTRQRDVTIGVGDSVRWAGYDLRLDDVRQRGDATKAIDEVELSVLQRGRTVGSLVPAQHFHAMSNEWTSEVSIYSGWSGDVYVILRKSESRAKVRLTLIENPMMRWMWGSAWFVAAGVALRVMPVSRQRSRTRLRHSSSQHITTKEVGQRAAAAIWMLFVLSPGVVYLAQVAGTAT